MTKLYLKLLAIPLMFAATSVLAKEARFHISLTLCNPIEVHEIRNMDFGTVLGGYDSKLVISPSSSGSAVFKATGIPYSVVTGSVVERQVTLKRSGSTGSTTRDAIVVDNFSFGGDMRNNGNAYFWSNGKLNNLRIGARANINSENSSGKYSGNATFRLTYL